MRAAACSGCAGPRRCSTPTIPARWTARTSRRASSCSGCITAPATSTPSSAAAAAGPPRPPRAARLPDRPPYHRSDREEPTMAPTTRAARDPELDGDEATLLACPVVEHEPDAEIPDGDRAWWLLCQEQ